MFLRVHLKPRVSDGPESAIPLRDLLLFFNQQDQTLVCEVIKKCSLKHATAGLNPTNVAASVFCDNKSSSSTFCCSRSGAIFALAGPHSRNVVDIGAIYDHSFRVKANVDPACSIVTRDFSGPSTITIVLANVSVVNCQLS